MNKKLLVYGVLAACSLIWGSSFILIKYALVAFDPLQVATLRLASAGLCLAPLALYFLQKRAKTYPWRKLGLAGLAGNFIPAFLFPLAISHINSGTAGALNSLTPLFTLALGIAFFGTVFQPWKLLGVVVGLAGALVLLFSEEQIAPGDSLSQTFLYGSLALIATIFYGFNANYVKHELAELKALEITSFALTLASLPAFVYLLSSDFVHRLETHPEALNSLGAAVALGCIGTAFALGLFFTMLKYASALFASTVTYFIPIVALIFGAMDGESFKVTHVLGMVLILGGVGLVNARKQKLLELLGRKA